MKRGAAREARELGVDPLTGYRAPKRASEPPLSEADLFAAYSLGTKVVHRRSTEEVEKR